MVVFFIDFVGVFGAVEVAAEDLMLLACFRFRDAEEAPIFDFVFILVGVATNGNGDCGGVDVAKVATDVATIDGVVFSF